MRRDVSILQAQDSGVPDLLTVRTLQILQPGSVVLYDEIVTTEILVLAPACVEIVYTKDEGHREQVPG